MSGTVWIIVGVTLLLILMLLTQFNAIAPRKEEREDEGPAHPPPATIESRIERYIGLLNYGDDETALEAIRHILSMGPGVLPILLKQINRLEQRPSALSPQCQLRIEELLISFGLVTYLECGDAVRTVHRASPVFPALMRIFVGIGPNLVVEIVRNPVLDPYGVVSPLLYRMGTTIGPPLEELLLAKPDEVSDALLLAALPTFAEHPDHLEDLFARSTRPGRERLGQALGWVGIPRVIYHLRALALDTAVEEPRRTGFLLEATVGMVQQGDLGRVKDLLASLDIIEDSDQRALLTDALPISALIEHLEVTPAERQVTAIAELIALIEREERAASWCRETTERALSLLEEGDANAEDWGGSRLAIRALGEAFADPRAVERLQALAEDQLASCGALALLELARHGHGAVESCMAARIRSAEISLLELYHLRLAAMRAGGQVLPLLERLLRSSSPRVASVAARIVVRCEFSVQPVVKALGRHRYAPTELDIAPLLLARLPEIRDEVVGLLGANDREVRQGALDLLAGFGRAVDLPAVLARISPESESIDSLLNAVEMVGSAGAGPLREFIEANPELSRHYALERRLNLLVLSAQQRTREPEELSSR